MQLLIILALLLYGGKSGAKNLIEEVKPVLETIGGDDVKEALKSAEEISAVLSAVKEFSGAAQQSGADRGQADAHSGNYADTYGGNQAGAYGGGGNYAEENGSPAVNFPLAPVNEFIGKDIAYSLSEYIKVN